VKSGFNLTDQSITLEVKDRILQASEELFLKYGIKSITMDEIARHLAISKKTIYQYYQDKDEIVYLVTQGRLGKDQEDMCEVFSASVNAIDEMMRVSEHLRIRMASTNPSLLFDLQKFHPQAWKIYLNHKRHFILERICDNLERGIREGLYRSDIRIDILSRMRIEHVQMGFDTSLFPLEQFNFIDVQTQLLDVFLRGIVTEKGLHFLQQYHNR